MESFWSPVDLSSIVEMIPPRGGATMINVNETIYVFGGANRGQINFCDLWMIKESDGNISSKCVECGGDVPMPRSDHAVVNYDDRYMLLFGGKNYENEECYNDLYIFNIATREWRYVGETGEEIEVRCGHTLGLLKTTVDGKSLDNSSDTVLVVYGGSSPETGTCSNDTYYAILPPVETVEMLHFFVHWMKLPGSTNNSVTPAAREMHSATQCSHSYLYISGGMSQQQSSGYSDVWRLSAVKSGTNTNSESVLEGQEANDNNVNLRWEQCHKLELPTPLYGHSSSINRSHGGRELYCVMSGISGGDCIVEDMLCCDVSNISMSKPSASEVTNECNPWTIVQWKDTPTQPVHFRLGISFLSGGVPQWMLRRYQKPRKNNKKKKKCKTSIPADLSYPDSESTVDNAAVDDTEQGDETALPTESTDSSTDPNNVLPAKFAANNCLLLFGGVDQNNDYHDMWLFNCNSHSVNSNNSSSDTAKSSSSSSHPGLVSVLA